MGSIPIFKKGQKTCSGGNNSPNTTMKLFSSILEDKLEAQIKNAEEQQGFIKGRSMTDAVFIIKQIKEEATEFNVPTYI